eukprot:gene12958-biopygen597
MMPGLKWESDCLLEAVEEELGGQLVAQCRMTPKQGALSPRQQREKEEDEQLEGFIKSDGLDPLSDSDGSSGSSDDDGSSSISSSDSSCS